MTDPVVCCNCGFAGEVGVDDEACPRCGEACLQYRCAECLAASTTERCAACA